MASHGESVMDLASELIFPSLTYVKLANLTTGKVRSGTNIKEQAKSVDSMSMFLFISI